MVTTLLQLMAEMSGSVHVPAAAANAANNGDSHARFRAGVGLTGK